ADAMKSRISASWPSSCNRRTSSRAAPSWPAPILAETTTTRVGTDGKTSVRDALRGFHARSVKVCLSVPSEADGSKRYGGGRQPRHLAGEDSMRVPLAIGDFIDRAALIYGDRTAVIDEPATVGSFGPMTYRELHARARGMALTLDEMGIGHGERVAIVSPN